MVSSLRHQRAPLVSLASQRDSFIAQLLTLTGDTRLLWLAGGADTTTSTDKSLNGRTVTYDATIAAQLVRQGFGYGVTFDGSSDTAFTPDAAGLSFGDSSTDVALSIIALANVTNTAAARALLSKFNVTSSLREWILTIDASDFLQFSLYDESVDKEPKRVSNAAITMGSPTLFGATYAKSTGGGSAATEMTLYQNGVVLTSTATNDASYVAMEDTAATVGVFSRGSSGGPEARFQGTGYMALVCQKALSASEHWAIYQLCKSYFNL